MVTNKMHGIIASVLAFNRGMRLSNQYNVIKYCKKFVNMRYPDFHYCGGNKERARRRAQLAKGIIQL